MDMAGKTVGNGRDRSLQSSFTRQVFRFQRLEYLFYR
jgi:hypothetical protein